MTAPSNGGTVEIATTITLYAEAFCSALNIHAWSNTDYCQRRQFGFLWLWLWPASNFLKTITIKSLKLQLPRNIRKLIMIYVNNGFDMVLSLKCCTEWAETRNCLDKLQTVQTILFCEISNYFLRQAISHIQRGFFLYHKPMPTIYLPFRRILRRSIISVNETTIEYSWKTRLFTVMFSL